MNRNDITKKARELVAEAQGRTKENLDKLNLTERAWQYIAECLDRCAALDKAKLEQVKMPVIMIKDRDSGEVRQFGTDIHDFLFIGRNGALQYYNAQNMETTEPGGAYSFFAEDRDENQDMFGPQMENQYVIRVIDELYPVQKPYCGICGSENNLHSLFDSSSWEQQVYCDQCYKKAHEAPDSLPRDNKIANTLRILAVSKKIAGGVPDDL